MITVKVDKENIQLESNIYKNIGYINDIQKDIGVDQVIPLKIDIKTFNELVSFIKLYEGELPEIKSLMDVDISEKDLKFFVNHNIDQLAHIITICNELNIEYIKELCCKIIAERFKGKNDHQAMEVLGIPLEKYDEIKAEIENIKKEALKNINTIENTIVENMTEEEKKNMIEEQKRAYWYKPDEKKVYWYFDDVITNDNKSVDNEEEDSEDE